MVECNKDFMNVGGLLKFAIKYGYIDIIKHLISQNVNIHAHEVNVLSLACKYRQIDILNYLLSLNEIIDSDNISDIHIIINEKL